MAKTFREYLEQSSLFTFGSTSGQIIPQTTEVLSSVKELMREVFDLSINVEDETPAGRLAEMFAIAIKRFATITATYANQVNPYYATGQMLDSIGSLFAVSRQGASSTVINITIVGTPGTVITAGSIISDQKGNEFTLQYNTPEEGIPVGGTWTTTAICTIAGELNVDNGTVTNIISTVVGWSAVTNTGISVYGTSIESDEHFRNRILQGRWTGTAFVSSIHSEIERCNNVDSVYVIENGESTDMYFADDRNFYSEITAFPETVEKYIKLSSHSICVIVYGKTLSSSDHGNIAEAIYSTKSAGCGYTSLDAASQDGTAKGTKVTNNVTDSISGAIYPITFNTPNSISFGVNISINKGAYRGTDEELESIVKNAIGAWSNGEAPFVDGLKLGQSLYAFEIGAAVSDILPAIQIRDVKMVINGSSVYSKNLFFYEIGVLDTTSINVYINESIPS